MLEILEAARKLHVSLGNFWKVLALMKGSAASRPGRMRK